MRDGDVTLIYDPDEWEHGLRCSGDGCDHSFEEGEAYMKRLEGFVDDVPVTLIVCVPCGMGLTNA